MSERFIIRRTLILRPLLLLIGFTRDANSYLTVEGYRLRARFGWFFNNVFSLADIESIEPSRWPWYGGLGWRSNLAGLVALVGSYHGVVEIRFKRRQRISGVVPLVKLHCDRLVVSLEQPDEFILALRRSIMNLAPNLPE
jgi:hypothetical protein